MTLIYFVTPTYPRREQVPELIRLAYTLLHVPRLHWIVANDYHVCNVYIDDLLIKLGERIESLTPVEWNFNPN
ncbi:galactosylgalactosylxylosylprotein 3-beta-glucuronosyltransferase S-like [Rhagoletis pomonella]|uniref:galactosylgalactosylxylosylprotein 3-beta-glucuronosyltransferase S-like n=1 Tax=Rhagoletis pomonella TaxID=28610 RepID=UPI00177C5CB9|nr:galactosylgalactosylxylosylprotein 3-beta-glucuronosyltransferase S-like [Rhagoletis pomonella]